jgi:hypothetical protein
MRPFEITSAVLTEARTFFEDCGADGNEGTAMLAGRAGGGRIDRLLIPAQRALRSPLGVAVEVTERGKLQIAAGLEPGERWFSRIHSHPMHAFHSEADDDNPALTAEGSLSIVVPYFGLGLRRGLGACAVFRLTAGRWQEISAVLPDVLVEVP